MRETEPSQTARHQLLLSTAADQASEQIAPNVPAGNRIYVETTHFSTEGEYQGHYAINTIKAALLKLVTAWQKVRTRQILFFL